MSLRNDRSLASLMKYWETELSEPQEPYAGRSDVVIYFLRLHKAQCVVDAARRLLSSQECERADSMRSSHGARTILARATLRHLLSQRTGIPHKELDIRHTELGKPVLHGQLGLNFSVSHSEDWACIGIADRLELGVDIEVADQQFPLSEVMHYALNEQERVVINSLDEDLRMAGFLSLWTIKEAVAKVTGRGVHLSFRKIAVPEWLVGGGMRFPPSGDITVNDTLVSLLPHLPGVVGAVAVGR